MIDSKQLETCPFCGSEAVINTSLYDTDLKQVCCPVCKAHTLWGEKAIQEWNYHKPEDPVKPCPLCQSKALEFQGVGLNRECFVQCTKCYLVGPAKSTIEEAVEAWNSRV